MTIRNTQKKGFTLSTQKAEVVFGDTVTVNRKDNDKDPFVVTSPGEYDIEEVTIFTDYVGQESENDLGNLSYLIYTDNLIIGYVPVPPKDLPKEVLPEYEQVNILLIPGSGAALVNELAVPVVIPIDNAEELAKELAMDVPDESSTYTANAPSDLPEETEIVYLG